MRKKRVRRLPPLIKIPQTPCGFQVAGVAKGPGTSYYVILADTKYKLWYESLAAIRRGRTELRRCEWDQNHKRWVDLHSQKSLGKVVDGREWLQGARNATA